MKLFTEFLANLNKERAGDTYRPANGFEENMFFPGECEGCIHAPDYMDDDGNCLTIISTYPRFGFKHTYPIELQYGKDGQPCCRRKTVLPIDPYENHFGDKFYFNDPVIFCFCHGTIDERSGRLVQVRRKTGAFGSDMYFLRRNDGSLITGENLSLKKYYGYVTAPIPDDSSETEYTILNEYPKTGFIINDPCGPPPTQQFFAVTITEEQ